MHEAEESRSKMMFEQRLEAAAESDDPMVLRNVTSALVAIGGDQEIQILASLAARLVGERNKDILKHRLELCSHLREESRTLPESGRQHLIAKLGKTENSAAARAILGLEERDAGLFTLFRAARSGWPRPRLMTILGRAFIGAAAGALAVWFALLAAAAWHGLVSDASQWPGVDLLIAAMIVGTAAGAGATAAAATGGLPRAQHLLRAVEALLFGAALALFVCVLAFFIPSASDLRELIMGSGRLPFGGGTALLGAFIALTLVGAITRAVGREMAEKLGTNANRMAGWLAGGVAAAIATFALFAILPWAAGFADHAIGLWLVAVPGFFAAGVANIGIDDFPARLAASPALSPRQKKSAIAFSATAFLAALLSLQARADRAIERSFSGLVPVPSTLSLMAPPGERLDVVAGPVRPGSQVPRLSISGGQVISPPPQGLELADGFPGSMGIVGARGGRLDICVSRPRERADISIDQSQSCEPNRLWWLRTLLGVARPRLNGRDGNLYVQPAGALIRRWQVSGRGALGMQVTTPTLLSAYFAESDAQRGFDAMVEVQRWSGQQWSAVGSGDDPPQFDSLSLPPGRYRLCVHGFAKACEADPVDHGWLYIARVPQPPGPLIVTGR